MARRSSVLVGVFAVLVLGSQAVAHPAAAAANLSGSCRIVDTVQYGDGTGQQFAFDISLGQAGNQIVGFGSGLVLEGQLDGASLSAGYSEDNGSLGTFSWTVDPTGSTLQGTFDNSSGNGGRSDGVRQAQPLGDVGSVQGFVVARNAIGRTWSLSGAIVNLKRVDLGAGAVMGVASAVVGNDNSFSFSSVPTGTNYFVELENIDPGPAGPCSYPTLFTVSAGQIATVGMRCVR